MSEVSTTMRDWGHDSKAVYGFGLCLRIAPFYRCFAQRYAWGTPDVVERALRDIFDALGTADATRAVASRWTPVLEAEVPDMDDFDSALVASLALDTISAALSLCDYITSGDDKYISDIEEIARNTAEFIDTEPCEFAGFAAAPDAVSYTEQEVVFRQKLIACMTTASDMGTLKQAVSTIAAEMAYPISA